MLKIWLLPFTVLYLITFWRVLPPFGSSHGTLKNTCKAFNGERWIIFWSCLHCTMNYTYNVGQQWLRLKSPCSLIIIILLLLLIIIIIQQNTLQQYEEASPFVSTLDKLCARRSTSPRSKWIFEPRLLSAHCIQAFSWSFFSTQSKFPQSLASSEAKHDTINESDFPPDHSQSLL